MRQPVSFALCGPPGHGKTTIAVKALPLAKKLAFTKQGFLIMDTVLGIPTKALEVPSIPKLIGLVKQMIAMSKEPLDWIFDDITLLILETAKQVYEAEVIKEQQEKQARVKPAPNGFVQQVNVDWFSYYDSIFDDLILLLDLIWKSDGYNISTFQLKDEKIVEGKKAESGGISIPHKASANLLNYGYACVYRTGVCSTRIPWPTTLICEGPFSKLLITKDRLNVVQGMKDCPANIAEILRYRGHSIEYPKEILPAEQMEDIRKFSIDQSANGKSFYDIEKLVRGNVKYAELKKAWIKWAITDGMDAQYIIANGE